MKRGLKYLDKFEPQNERVKLSSNFSVTLEVKVAVEAIKERYSFSELGQRELHHNQIIARKKEFLSKVDGVFEKATDKHQKPEVKVDKLCSKIGQLELECGFLKKAYLSWIC